MDRISELPHFIVHHILSYLYSSCSPPADLVRMSVLSKTWFDLTASFPILDFDICAFRSGESFFKYVEYTTSRFCHQNVTAERLYLIADLKEPTEIDIVNRSLELVLKQGVRNLVVDIKQEGKWYCLPYELLSVSVLESLIIFRCELPSSLMVDDAVNLKSLIELKLEYVSIDDEGIKYLTTGCPLLQVLTIRFCYGFNRFCIPRHENLQEVLIDNDTPLERIDIEAPNLSCLWVLDADHNGAPQMNLDSCKNLATVTYNGVYLPDDFLSNFPFIENLCVTTYDTCNNLKWSSHSLRTLMLISDYNLDRIELDTPNLALFLYGSSCNIKSDAWCQYSFGDPTDLKGCIRCSTNCFTDTLWFQKLRLFLGKKIGFKVLNFNMEAVYSWKFIELEELNSVELPPYELEHVELELDIHGNLSAYMNFVDAVLWCFRPQCLTLRSSFTLTNHIVKYICEKLLQQEDHGHTNFHIVTSVEGKTASFIKKEGRSGIMEQ